MVSSSSTSVRRTGAGGLRLIGLLVLGVVLALLLPHTGDLNPLALVHVISRSVVTFFQAF